ncbi:uncharacterized protein LOC106656254 [Trichogramma pretiosum]|uniref:uncharacterized protein LOC106656254 n=1 Tax=Trichogramma pretiosum TaxID=7493 RepID=UPI0006C95236|nr:uncharacterized protein LOC106656254 [Trichogramma pretiosum]
MIILYKTVVCLVFFVRLFSTQDIIFRDDDHINHEFVNMKMIESNEESDRWQDIGTSSTSATPVESTTPPITTSSESTSTLESATESTSNPPVQSNVTCPENMIFYTDAQICDCKPYFVFFEKEDACYEVYTQGPCPLGHYAYAGLDSPYPKCIFNHCLKDNYVIFKDSCYEMRKVGGVCGDQSHLYVNQDTLELECVDTSLIPFFIVGAPPNNRNACPPGSRRNKLGHCKVIYGGKS